MQNHNLPKHIRIFGWALGFLVGVSLACGQYVTPTPTPVSSNTPNALVAPTLTATIPTSTAQPVPTEQSAAVVKAVVNVRNAPNGDVISFLTIGESVTVLECTDEWCRVDQGWVWRGCLSDNPAALGCSAK